MHNNKKTTTKHKHKRIKHCLDMENKNKIIHFLFCNQMKKQRKFSSLLFLENSLQKKKIFLIIHSIGMFNKNSCFPLLEFDSLFCFPVEFLPFFSLFSKFCFFCKSQKKTEQNFFLFTEIFNLHD